MSKKRFKDVWKNQTDIGKLFGRSAVAVGKALKAAGLKDPLTGSATDRAVDEGFAVPTPLWNVEKVAALLAEIDRLLPRRPETRCRSNTQEMPEPREV